MSSLFNQTNIAPGTSFSGVGGGSNFPSGLTVGSVGSLVATNVHNTPYLTVEDTAGSARTVLVTGALYTGTDAFGYNLQLGGTGLLVQAGTGTSKTWLSPDLGSGFNQNIQSLSTLTAVGASQKINMIALTSTLATAFPGCIG